MNLREANLERLRRFHPEAARRIEALPVHLPLGQWSASRSGQATVKRGGVSLASAFDPVGEARKAVPPWDADLDLAVLSGLGAGYLAEAAAEAHPDLPLVVVEEDPVWLAEVLAHRDLRELLSNPRVVLLLGPDPRVLADFLATLSCRNVEVLSWRPVATQSPDWDSRLSAQIAAAQAQAGVNLATYRRFSGLWKRNLARNEALSVSVRPVAALAGWAGGCPAVIAAAGPSLAAAFDWMRTRRDGYLLIAVDTAWPSLSAHGFVPDILVVLDGQYWNGRHVDLAPPEGTLVVTEWIGPTRAFQLAAGRTYVAASSAPFLRAREARVWGQLGALPSGGSVATAAWSLALLLGCSEVAFAGLDLGYPSGRSHVPGSQFQESVQRRSGRLRPAETLGLGLRGWEGLTWRPSLDGGAVRSDARMDLFRDWLSASVSAHPEVKAVNLSRTGSVVPGLLPPPRDYGAGWPLRKPLPPRSVPLKRLPARSSASPSSLRRLLSAPDFGAALEPAWREAREYWGATVWDAWAGRARRTWELWPSDRSRRAVEEVVALALEWDDFGRPAAEFQK